VSADATGVAGPPGRQRPPRGAPARLAAAWPHLGLAAALLFAGAAGCALKKPPEQHYYDEHIQPFLNSFCVGNTSPCHAIDPSTGLALGNLDLSSFEAVQKRPDVLRTYGSYPMPLLLMKTVPEESVQIPYRGKFLVSEIRHAGGKTLSTSSDAFAELLRWLANGANRDGVAPIGVNRQGQGACNTSIPGDRDTSVVDTSSTAYRLFTTDVAPMLMTSCTFATCHSSPQSDFYLTCGTDDAQQRFNYLQASGFVVQKPDPTAPSGTNVEQSEILLRPLAPSAGGVSHTGGVFFASRSDDTWVKWRAWAVAVEDDPPEQFTRSNGQQFFEANVMPKLLQRGCALEGCHSPDGFNDYRLRPGGQGFFAATALRRNYEITIGDFMSVDSPDVTQSRAVKKTIFPQSGGIPHRGGPLLEGTAGMSSAADCPAVYDPATASAFCTFVEWHRIERVDRAATVSSFATGTGTGTGGGGAGTGTGTTLPLAFVARPPDPDGLLEFDTFRPGADLRIADATLDGAGRLTALTNARSALGACAGLVAGSVDVRGPDWSYDASQLVFAARTAATSGLDLWEVDVAGGTPGACRRLTDDDGRMLALSRVHNFDPMFAPDGSIVFASTRTGTLTPKTFLPNADLFRSGPAADFGAVEQMTYLLGSELSPAMMQDGRVSFTAEKASPEFYQLSGRRLNWDLSDYHPLLGQRAQSTTTFDDTLYPSIGYAQATEIREGLDRNFLVILSDVGARGGGGALATFNRSIGPFEADRTDPTFLRSLHVVDSQATGRDSTVGAYRSPASLPNGEILVSYAANVRNTLTDTPQYALVATTLGDASASTDGTRRALLADPALSLVEATLGYRRSATALFRNIPQLVFGGHETGDDFAVMHFPDLSMLATLLGDNLRRGRDVARFDTAVALKVYEERPPPGPNPGGLQGSQMVYVDRVSLGSVPLASDHSVKVYMPARKPLILELVDGAGKPVLTMREEHQVSAGEYITPGVPRQLFNGVCGGCHGSISGSELDVAVDVDALTGASVSLSRDPDPQPLR
jgi:hypothetical protein